jgi:sigma-E factor negative regulatory protein RseB
MRFAPVIYGIGGLLLMTQSAQAVESMDWLNKLSISDKVNSQGAFIYESNGHLTSHHIARKVDSNGDVKERLYRLDGTPYEVVRDNNRIVCSTSADDQADVAKTLAPKLKPEQINKGYTIKHLGESRVADSATDVVAFMPKDPYRYAYEMQLSKSTGQMLKSTTFDQKGNALERLQYITYSSLSPSAEELASKADCAPRVEAEEISHVDQATWRASWLPSGFERIRSLKSWQAGGEGRPVQYLLYSDGLSNFSVFVDSDSQTATADSRNRFGPTSVVSKRINPSDKDVLITVVGEIPAGTAERIALSVRPD